MSTCFRRFSSSLGTFLPRFACLSRRRRGASAGSAVATA